MLSPASTRRHVDGVWRSADEVPRTADGRPVSYIALHGHGSYPVTGRIVRLFGAFNDHTSARGASSPLRCEVIEHGLFAAETCSTVTDVSCNEIVASLCPIPAIPPVAMLQDLIPA